MRTKTIKNVAIFFSFFLLLWGCEEFFRREIGGFAGSYPFVEYWEIEATEQEILVAIKELKQEDTLLQSPYDKELIPERNSEYDWDSPEMIEYSRKVQTDSLLPLPPKTDANTKGSYWLYIDFYYSDTREVVHTWTRPGFGGITTFALVSLNDRLINRDYWFLANKWEIHKFKKRIVDKIQEKIDKKREATS
ncbi:hypothetical protein QNI16_18305 [Cytophagaceae bacterium YF14B1]|uniref:Uncharacterized protein n=1 Tax=Xanthocytophaga flava TaxID=3048013 RepID=A0AAE3U8A4_9BACT|nr:hypothetical protein [Xanthocytophaga flavus]MDJ1482462.1 hypothetical protein [Xanthocytophaga flavus]